jgi:hypothetical protein
MDKSTPCNWRSDCGRCRLRPEQGGTRLASSVVDADVERLVSYIECNIHGLENDRLDNEFDYASLPLCIIDAVFSLGAHYESTRHTVRGFCQAHGWEMSAAKDGIEHTTSELISILEPYSTDFERRNPFDNRQRTSSRSGITKAEAVYRFALALHEFGIETLSNALSRGNDTALEQRIKSIPGQASGLSFSYFLILAGHRNFVKADRMVRRFVSAGIGRPRVSEDHAKWLIVRACAGINCRVPDLTPAALDNAIWKFQRGQPRHRRAIRPSPLTRVAGR